MAKKILVMGLPGSGKTYLAEKLAKLIDAHHLNADVVRAEHDDWDFSDEGRKRQAQRMNDLSSQVLKDGRHVIADFVCPTPETRKNFNPDVVIWMDTISEGRFEDTNKVFVKPNESEFDFRITEHNEGEFWPVYISKRILSNKWDNKHPSVQLLGRWQPWHEGHRALFERAIQKTGQVCVMVRDCEGWGDNPFSLDSVKKHINENLKDMYEEGVDYVVHHVPNIVHITYGRTVGYTIAQEHFNDEIHSISATKKRKEMRENGELE